jgi:hypothetical protein
MIKAKRLGKWTSVLAVWALLGTVAAQSQTVMYRLGPLPESSDPLETDVIMQLGRGEILFQVEDPRAAAVQVQVSDAAGEVLYESGVQGGREIRWSRTFSSTDCRLGTGRGLPWEARLEK